MTYISLPDDKDFTTKFNTYILAYSPDMGSWFVTNERFFYYEYDMEFSKESSAIEYFKEHAKVFYDIELQLGIPRPSIFENGVFLENTREFIEVSL